VNLSPGNLHVLEKERAEKEPGALDVLGRGGGTASDARSLCLVPPTLRRCARRKLCCGGTAGDGCHRSQAEDRKEDHQREPPRSFISPSPSLAAASQVCTFESFGILSPVPYPCTLTWCLESQIFHSPLPSHHELFPVLSDSVMHVGAG